ncbi:hypothetical protein FTUN_0499 [Frigoriglobus tundricola]|uniref:Uncharacterized protein n=1 Tax=Frigoriglobus tundricola TaxID=2774151 RepID=A0A6M5YG21_9BACT|nr:hypothetical protein FTUN_0499 [Frigoriglobus tundricola]
MRTVTASLVPHGNFTPGELAGTVTSCQEGLGSAVGLKSTFVLASLGNLSSTAHATVISSPFRFAVVTRTWG